MTTLGECRVRQTAQVRNCSDSGLGLLVQIAIPAGTALRIEWGNAILLGEAMYQRPAPGGFFVGVHLEHVLAGLRELKEQARRFQDAEVTPASR